MEINKIYNEHCFLTMKNMIENKIFIDGVITSPFYGTTRKRKNQNKENQWLGKITSTA